MKGAGYHAVSERYGITPIDRMDITPIDRSHPSDPLELGRQIRACRALSAFGQTGHRADIAE
jgi:hypothetical protein